MSNDTKTLRAKDKLGSDFLPAGDFSAWLSHARNALINETNNDVDCTDCDACCSSSYFIHIQPKEKRTLGRIPQELLFPAPGMPPGHVVLGYDNKGRCPMLKNGKCSIYDFRALTCRNYDCRIFTAAGIAAGEKDKARITQRAKRWKFSYPTKRDHEEHAAVQAAARFIQEHAECFPGGAVPTNPSQLAILAIKVYAVFLKNDEGSAKTRGASLDTEMANTIVHACKTFDATRQPLL